MIIAGTGSGKTTCVVIPTLLNFAHSNQKPSLLVTDPKGEIFNQNSQLFDDQGYEDIKIDLRNSRESNFWNPLAIVFNNWKRGFLLEQEFSNDKNNEQ